jgi:hypothetical protein
MKSEKSSEGALITDQSSEGKIQRADEGFYQTADNNKSCL